MANQIHWYKRDPKVMLSLEERGAYNTILDLIYCHDGRVDDDPKLICFWLKCNVRIWRRIRAKLLERGKLYELGGQLRNARADREAEAAKLRIKHAAQAGLASAAKREADLKFRKGLQATDVQPPSQLPTTTSTKSLSLSLPHVQIGSPERNSSKRPQDVSKAELAAILAAKRSAAG